MRTYFNMTRSILEVSRASTAWGTFPGMTDDAARDRLDRLAADGEDDPALENEDEGVVRAWCAR